MTTSNDIALLVNEIITDLKEISNKDSLDVLKKIESNIIQPVQRSFVREDTYEHVKSVEKVNIDLWVILEDKHSGYSLVYDDRSNEFGLSLLGSDGIDRFIGVKGSLLYAYEAM